MNKHKNFIPLLAVTILLSGMVIFSSALRRTQIFKNNAEVNGGVGSITISPSSANKNVGNVFPATISFNTGGAAISSLAFRITYPYLGTTPDLDVVDANGNLSNQIYPDNTLVSSGNWAFPIKSVTRVNNLVTVDFAAINTSIAGFSTSSNTNLAVIYFKVNPIRTPRSVTLSFSVSNSYMYTKSNSMDVLNPPVNAVYRLKK